MSKEISCITVFVEPVLRIFWVIPYIMVN